MIITMRELAKIISSINLVFIESPEPSAPITRFKGSSYYYLCHDITKKENYCSMCPILSVLVSVNDKD